MNKGSKTLRPPAVVPMDFKGAVALVTGASGGLGRAIVAHLRASGARVAALDLQPARGRRRSDDLLELRRLTSVPVQGIPQTVGGRPNPSRGWDQRV